MMDTAMYDKQLRNSKNTEPQKIQAA